MSEEKFVDIYSYFWDEEHEEPKWKEIRRLQTYLTFRQKICALYLLKDNKVRRTPPGKNKLKDIILNREYRRLNKNKEDRIYFNSHNSHGELPYLKRFWEEISNQNLDQSSLKYSCLIEVHFRLKKPYLSKDDDTFYIIDNPVVKDKVFKLPMVRSTTWKGALRFAALKVIEKENLDENILVRLFGNKREEKENFKQGRLFFYPTFFDRISLDVITPLSRETKTPVRGPIYFEIVPENAEGIFRILYYPFDLVAKGEFDKVEIEAKEDLEIVAKTINKMFYKIGFSAKKMSGFGTAEVEKIEIKSGEGIIGKKKDIENSFKSVETFKDKVRVI